MAAFAILSAAAQNDQHGFATYNYINPHGILTKEAEGVKTAPAMRSSLTNHVWTMVELLAEATKISKQSKSTTQIRK